MDNLGYTYRVTRQENENTRYYKCVVRTCMGSGRVVDGHCFEATRLHNHYPLIGNRTGSMDVQQFKYILIHRVTIEVCDLHTIYNEEAAKYPMVAAIYPWKYAYRCMLWARKNLKRRQPKTILSMKSMLLAEYNSRDDFKYETFLRSVSGKTIFIYASKIVIATVAKLRPPVNMYVDSSFSMFPPRPAFDKIIIIHLVKGTRSFPCVMSFMEQEDLASYKVLMKYLKNHLFKDIPHYDTIVVKLYPKLKQLMISIFEPFTIHSCLYFHMQGLWKTVKKFYLLPEITHNSKAKKCLAMLMALPLLPQHKALAGFEYIQKFCLKNRLICMSEMMGYCKYIWKEWFENVEIFDRTLFNETHSTGNCLKTFQKNIVKTADQYRNSFTVWKLINTMYKMSTNALHEAQKALLNDRGAVKAMDEDIELEFNETDRLSLFLTRASKPMYSYINTMVKAFNRGFDKNKHDDEDLEGVLLLEAYQNGVITLEDEEVWPDFLWPAAVPAADPAVKPAPAPPLSMTLVPVRTSVDYYKDIVSESYRSDGSSSGGPPVPMEVVQEVSPKDTSDWRAATQGHCMVCASTRHEYKYAMVPCGHSWLCRACITNMISKCPICEAQVNSYLRIVETSL